MCSWNRSFYLMYLQLFSFFEQWETRCPESMNNLTKVTQHVCKNHKKNVFYILVFLQLYMFYISTFGIVEICELIHLIVIMTLWANASSLDISPMKKQRCKEVITQLEGKELKCDAKSFWFPWLTSFNCIIATIMPGLVYKDL